MPVAAAAAVAAQVTGRRVRYQLDRNADMRTNGGMPPYLTLMSASLETCCRMSGHNVRDLLRILPA
jgi:xanthine dehydrogenase molybdopterin-binding subunit B